MRRKISQKHLERLKAEAEEAKTLKLGGVYSSLNKQIERNTSNVRGSDEFYSYAQDELKDDIKDILWDAATRIHDYLGKNADASDVEQLVKNTSEELFKEISNLAGVKDGVGENEPNVPGEKRGHVEIEIEYED